MDIDGVIREVRVIQGSSQSRGYSMPSAIQLLTCELLRLVFGAETRMLYSETRRWGQIGSHASVTSRTDMR